MTTHFGLRIQTTKQTETVDITDRVAEKVKEANVNDGICVVTADSDAEMILPRVQEPAAVAAAS